MNGHTTEENDPWHLSSNCNQVVTRTLMINDSHGILPQSVPTATSKGVIRGLAVIIAMLSIQLKI